MIGNLERVLRDDGRVTIAALTVALVGADVGSGRRAFLLKPRKRRAILSSIRLECDSSSAVQGEGGIGAIG